MGIQWRNPGTWLWKALDPHDVEERATQLRPQNAEGSERVAKEDGNLPAWRCRGKRTRATKAVIVAVVVIVVSGARYIMSRRSRSYLRTSQLSLDDVSQLPLDDASMHKYLDDFNEAADEMKKAWESSGSPVRQAFQKHFTPSIKDGQELSEDPLATISDHVTKMRECEVPPDSSVEARRDFVQHLQLLHSICRTATLRLEELNWFVGMNEQFGVPVPVPGHDEPLSYPSLKELEEMAEDGVRATDFLNAVGLAGVGTMEKVDKALVGELISMLDIWNRSTVDNLMARYYFERLLQPLGEDGVFHTAHSTAEYQIPYTGKAFRTGALAQAAARIFRQADSTPTYANVRRLRRIADNWSTKGVLGAAKEQEKENADDFEDRLNTRREQMQALLKEGIPSDDLVISALFLL